MIKYAQRFFLVLIIFLFPLKLFASNSTFYQGSLCDPIQIFDKKYDVYGLRTNLIYGKNNNLLGLDLGFGVNEINNTTGAQIAGLINKANGNVVGLQLAGFGNKAGGVKGTFEEENTHKSTAVQIAGLSNIADNIFGGQFSMFFNYAKDKVTGIQFGAVNITEKANGANIGFINSTSSVNGLQFGFANLANRQKANINGLQLGVFNVASNNVTGAQIGIINTCNKLTGMQVGLLNFNKSGKLPVFPLIYPTIIKHPESTNFLYNKHEFDFKFGGKYYKFTEPNIRKNSGFMASVGAQYNYHSDYRYMLKTDLEYSWGGLTNENLLNAQESDINSWILDFKGALGYDILFDKDIILTPYIGAGYRTFQFNPSNNNVVQKDFSLIYSPIGISFNNLLNANWKLGFNLEYDLLWQARIKNYFNNISSLNNNPINHLNTGEGYGAYGSVSLSYKIDNLMAFSLEPYIRYWYLNETDQVDLTESQIPKTQGAESNNYSIEYGLNINISPIVFGLNNNYVAKNEKESFLRPKHDFTAKFGIENYKYEEPGLMDNSGVLYSIEGDYKYHSDVNLLLGTNVEYAWGLLDYDGSTSAGTPQKNITKDWIFDTRGIIGYDIEMGKNYLFSPFTGIGYRYLYDMGEAPSAYKREQTYLYSPIGVMFNMLLNKLWKLGATIEYDLFWQGRIKSYLGGISPPYYNNPVNHQAFAKGYGLRGSITITRKLFSSFAISIEPFIKYWNIDQSDTSVLSWMNIPQTYGVEPDNNTLSYGAKIGISF